jgi:hypothetical protein
MTSIPRIARAVPTGPATRAVPPIAVVVTLRWATGQVTEVEAEAVTWTRNAVEVSWVAPGDGRRTDWVEAADVRRAGSGTDGPARPGPPRSTARRHPRW